MVKSPGSPGTSATNSTSLPSQPDLASQRQASKIADLLLQAPPYNLKPSRPPVTPVPPPSRPIKVNQGRSNPELNLEPFALNLPEHLRKLLHIKLLRQLLETGKKP